VPETVRQMKAIEILQLFQKRGTSVAEHTRAYERLYRYGRRDTPDEQSRVEHYRKRLLPDIARQLGLHQYDTYKEMVRGAFRAEQLKRQEEERTTQLSVWEVGESSGQKRPRVEEVAQQLTVGPRAVTPARQGYQGPRPTQPRPQRPPQPGQQQRGGRGDRGRGRGRGWGRGEYSRCFTCGDVGHRAVDCTATGPRCYNCGYVGHIANRCQYPRGAAARASAQRQ